MSNPPTPHHLSDPRVHELVRLYRTRAQLARDRDRRLMAVRPADALYPGAYSQKWSCARTSVNDRFSLTSGRKLRSLYILIAAAQWRRRDHIAGRGNCTKFCRLVIVSDRAGREMAT